MSSRLGFRDWHDGWNTHDVVEVTDGKPNGKKEERSKGFQKVEKPSKCTDSRSKDVDHGGQRQLARSLR